MYIWISLQQCTHVEDGLNIISSMWKIDWISFYRCTHGYRYNGVHMDIVTTVYTCGRWVEYYFVDVENRLNIISSMYTWISLQRCTHGYHYNLPQCTHGYHYKCVHMDIITTLYKMMYTWISLQRCTHGYHYNRVHMDIITTLYKMIFTTVYT